MCKKRSSQLSRIMRGHIRRGDSKFIAGIDQDELLLAITDWASETSNECVAIQDIADLMGWACIPQKMSREETLALVWMALERYKRERSFSHRRDWSNNDDEFIRNHYPLHGASYCASHLKRHHSSISSRAMHLGVKKIGPNSRDPWPPEDDELLSRLYMAHSAREIASRMGRSVESIKNRVQVLGIRKNR